MRRRLLSALLGLALLLGVSARAGATENVWSGLVIATNTAKPEPPPPEMRRFAETLRQTFGYKQFSLIGQSRKTLNSGEENWLARSKHFSLHVDARGATKDGYRLKLTLFQDRHVLLETDATLKKSSPLVIKGPQVGAGQLLLLLIVQ
ncbi:MAG: hypothetical protein ABI233_12485 [Chthoniobacterales bacterium]